MGQKVNPHGLRVGIIAPWSSTWYANKKDFGKNLKEDDQIRKYIKTNYYDAAISKIVIERAANTVKIDIYCGRVGVAVGKMSKKDATVEETGAKKKGIEEINAAVRKIVGNDKTFSVNVHEVKNVDMDAQIVAESIAAALEKRTPFRRAMKFAMGRAMRAGAKGIKTMVSGRLDGAEIARSESYHEGSIPLQTLRADIDYGFARANTTYGIIGVKVWIYKGEVFAQKAAKKGGND